MTIFGKQQINGIPSSQDVNREWNLVFSLTDITDGGNISVDIPFSTSQDRELHIIADSLDGTISYEVKRKIGVDDDLKTESVVSGNVTGSETVKKDIILGLANNVLILGRTGGTTGKVYIGIIPKKKSELGSSENATTITDPAVNAAVTTAIIDEYSGNIITLTAAGNSQTLQNPTDTAVIKRFIVVADDGNGSHAIEVNGITLSAGEAQWFIWDGSAWVAITAVDADDISFTPTGSVVATDVQAAIAEVDTEKAPIESPTFTGTATMPKISQVSATENESKFLEASDYFGDHVIKGGLPPTSATLSSDIPALIARVTGVRVLVAITSHEYPINSDTYLDVFSTGTYAFQSVGNGGAEPALTADSMRLAKVVTDATHITSVTDMRQFFKIYLNEAKTSYIEFSNNYINFYVLGKKNFQISANICNLNSNGTVNLGAKGSHTNVNKNLITMGGIKFQRNVQSDITAHAGGGQANATTITGEIVRISVCATAGDSVKFTDSNNGSEQRVINDGAQSADLFPASGEYINGAQNTAISIPVAGQAIATCYAVGHWKINII